MNRYDDYMNEAFKLLNVGYDCNDCKSLIEIKDAFSTGDSPSDFECSAQQGSGWDYKDCLRTDDMEELALDMLSDSLLAISENNLKWLLDAIRENKPEELGYKLLEEL